LGRARAVALVVTFAVAALGAGCGPPPRIPDKDGDAPLAAGSTGRFIVDDPKHQDWRDRSFLVHVPKGYDGDAIPVVIVIHGGGGNAEGGLALTCPGGNSWDAACLVNKADKEGFAVVAPEGTPAHFFPNHRTWNSGGGNDEVFRCVAGRACEENVDDVAFFDALLAEVGRGITVDDSRIFVTGMSNGAAMAHRLACERSTVYAAIAPVGGGNQLQAVQGCNPAQPVPMLQIHGTDDPCWRFSQGAEMGSCAATVNGTLVHLSMEESVEGWRARNGCGEEFSEDDIADVDDDDSDDGVSAVHRRFSGCLDGADVEFIIVDGGGHTWPRGHGFLGEDIIGKTTTDFSANDVIWDFFSAHPRR
jgi:polyhydroxybutyrate depolymerase